MSIIDSHSCECTTSPLEWFNVLPTQTAVEKTSDVEYQPLTSLRENAPVEFYIPASTDDYLDLKNTKLVTTFQILKPAGYCTDDDMVVPINNIFDGLWSNIECFINDRLISHSNNTHGYTSMISHLIHDSEESWNSQGSMQLIYKDTAGDMDSVDFGKQNIEKNVYGFHIVNAGTGNNGAHLRYLFTKASTNVSVMGSLRIDLFEQERYLPSGLSIKLRFHRQRDNFMLMAARNDDGIEVGYKILLKEAYLMVRKVKTSPGVQLGHADALMTMPAKFPITRKECKILAFPQGGQTFVKDNIFLGQLPKRVVIAMVDNDAFAGNYEKNPYNFKHYNINFIQLYTDGEPVLTKAIQIHHTNYLPAYETLYRGFDRLDGSKSSIIKREDWDKGYALFAFDLTPDYDEKDRYPIIKHGNLRLEMQFSDALTQTVNVIVYAEFDNIVEITGNRNVQFDYT